MQLRNIRTDERGLTLVEIIVVLIILVVIAGVIFPKVFGQGEAAKARVNGLKMQEIKNLVQQYQLAYNDFPPTLDALIHCPANLPACAPLTTDEETLKDVWGTPFVYSIDGGGRSYRITSLGADKREGGSSVGEDRTITGP